MLWTLQLEGHKRVYDLLYCPGPWFNIKMSSYQYRKSHYGDKTILRPSYLHNGISYTGKMISLYWIRALIEKGPLSNPCTNGFILENMINILTFLSFLNSEMVQVVEGIPHGRQRHLYPTKSTSWLLMAWQCKESCHQQPWYWPSPYRLFWF